MQYNLKPISHDAIPEALEKAQAMAQDKMSAITGGLNIPGMF